MAGLAPSASCNCGAGRVLTWRGLAVQLAKLDQAWGIAPLVASRGSGRIINKESFFITDEVENPHHLLAGRFDLAFVVVYLLPLVVMIFVMGLFPQPFLDRINPSVDAVLKRVEAQYDQSPYHSDACLPGWLAEPQKGE